MRQRLANLATPTHRVFSQNVQPDMRSCSNVTHVWSWRQLLLQPRGNFLYSFKRVAFLASNAVCQCLQRCAPRVLKLVCCVCVLCCGVLWCTMALFRPVVVQRSRVFVLYCQVCVCFLLCCSWCCSSCVRLVLCMLLFLGAGAVAWCRCCKEVLWLLKNMVVLL